MTRRKIRESLTPMLTRREMARRMQVSETYLKDLERGTRPWTPPLAEAFDREIEAWKVNPDDRPRKIWGKVPGTPFPSRKVAVAAS